MDEGVASSCASGSSRERQRDPPTTPERSFGVDITDAFDRLDLECTPKSSRHDITKPSSLRQEHHPQPLQARKILFPTKITSDPLPNWTVAELEGLILFLMLHSSGNEWVNHKHKQFWDQAGTFIQQLLKTSYCRTG